MFIGVCNEFIQIMKELVKKDIEFKMWTDDFNGNVGINITGKNGNDVDISQYMSPIEYDEKTNKYREIPIGLSIMYKTQIGRKTFDEGNDVDRFLSDILEFIEEV